MARVVHGPGRIGRQCTARSVRASRRTAANLAILFALLLAACSGSGNSTSGSSSSSSSNAATVKLMTRNLYLGADLQPIFAATADTLTAALQATYQQVVDSEVDARLGLVAKEIAAGAPDLVALQEASVWTSQATADAQPTVVYDFVTTLLAKLDVLGERYTVAASSDGFKGGLPVAGVGIVTLQDRDVILHRDGSPVTTSDPNTGQYTTKLTLSVLGAPVEVVRGWASVVAGVGGRTLTFMATHLEAFDDPTRDKQQTELLALMDRATGPAIVTGDLNSAAGTAGSHAYDAMLAAGYQDAWLLAGNSGTVPTCCYDAALTSGSLTQRIDFILTRGRFDVTAAAVVGTDPASRTPGGRWPSDHAGVIATVVPAG